MLPEEGGGASVLVPVMNRRVSELLTAKEVAARLGVCTATVYKLTGSGALPHLRVLNTIRVPEDELERFLANAVEASKK